jgi:GT2 family glycosyltransferase
VIAEKFPQVKLIRNKENQGFAKANNTGIRQSSGKYICLVNSDVLVLDKCIEKLIKFMDAHPSTGMVGPRILNPDRTLQYTCRHFPSLWNNICQALGLNRLFPRSAFFSEPFMKYWPHDTQRKVEVLTGCFWFVRRIALDTVGLLDESFFIYGEDIDWCKRFHLKGWEIEFYPGAEAIHFGGASSSNAPIRFYLEMQKADLQYWKKHHGWSGQAFYTVIILIRHLIRLVSEGIKYGTSSTERNITSFKIKRGLACIRFVLHI